jgi:hypothetical protein
MGVEAIRRCRIDEISAETKVVLGALNFAPFVTFFPHLVAGPIMRRRDLLSQFARPERPIDLCCCGRPARQRRRGRRPLRRLSAIAGLPAAGAD